MNDELKISDIIKWVLGGFILLAILGFAGNSLELFNLKFWAPKQEAAKRKVYEETPSYIAANNQHLAKYHHEWMVTKDEAEKKAIEGMVRQELASVKPETIADPLLQSWFIDIMSH
jgi:hypothetical protein